ncbi:MAG: conserved hypothetical protein [Methanobrevibacter sp. CfCl-M3]
MKYYLKLIAGFIICFLLIVGFSFVYNDIVIKDLISSASTVNFEAIKHYGNEHIDEKIKMMGTIIQCDDKGIVISCRPYTSRVICSEKCNCFKDITVGDVVKIYGRYRGLDKCTLTCFHLAGDRTEKLPKIDVYFVEVYGHSNNIGSELTSTFISGY